MWTTLFSLTMLLVRAQATTFTYQFDPSTAGGVSGVIRVTYESPESTKATIAANLDFSKVDAQRLKSADGNCTGPVTEYKWHIHTKWSSNQTSDAFAQCSKAAAGNHYDPLYACGPASEYVDAAECQGKVAQYACNPSNYTKDPKVCEKGDLSGKFGGFQLDPNQRVRGEWTDLHYPTVKENTKQWNMLLHAVCGKATPRVACATATQSTTPAPTTTPSNTPKPKCQSS